MSVFISMLFAVFIWSLYPLAATIGLKSMSSMQMIIMVYIFSGIGAFVLAMIHLKSTGKITDAIRIQKSLPQKAYFIIIASGIAGVLCHGLFIFALTLANKAGVSLLFESWPIIAVVATPMLMKKTWKEVSLKDFIVSLIALLGVAIIILSDKGLNFNFNSNWLLSENFDYKALGGYILSFVGAYMCAIVVVTKGAYSEYFSELNDSFSATLVSEMISRLICMILVIILCLTTSTNLAPAIENWHMAFFVGFVVFVVGSALYTYALITTERPTIHIVNYFVPVLAVIWLWVARETEVNAGLFIGGAIVLGANIYLAVTGRQAKFSEKI